MAKPPHDKRRVVRNAPENRAKALPLEKGVGGFAFAQPKAFFGGGLASFRHGDGFAARPAMKPDRLHGGPKPTPRPGEGESLFTSSGG